MMASQISGGKPKESLGSGILKDTSAEIATKIENGLQHAMEVGLANDSVLDEMTVRLRDQQASFPL